MPEKDIAEKSLEEYNDVFADIVNVLLFDGKPLVKEDALTDASRLEQDFHNYLASAGNLFIVQK